LDLWAVAVYDFRLSSEDFWELTPPQFAALSRRHDQHQEQRHFGAGVVASTIANCHRDPQSRPEPFTPLDFMPRYSTDDDAEETTGEMTPEQIKQRMLAAFPKMPEVHGAG
jgi:hypothetical protein